MITLDVDQVMHLHDLLIKRTGGKDGLRDIGTLESAIYHAYATFEGKDLYPSIEEKTARQIFSLITNHAFVDGNKRIGALVLLVLLEMNDIQIEYTQKELIDLAMGTAEGKIDAVRIFQWIENHKVVE
ncbi:MAG: type II toxin-antitoxin system death-on-curing family toxin [Christensenella sp.]|uniref:type II toxin-antitoxin system death-on-curing family toxin n=1 Tax=Christensenella sp. TaxID=1935934 RepID=UPI002B1EF257|nr:type II toxin-antitoxin system death-on-curing family toxin [Christensenella sp.]MEA5002039.1 type II toxin-antitoxin system death-on-curing family toxin [Christensenella sp.]